MVLSLNKESVNCIDAKNTHKGKQFEGDPRAANFIRDEFERELLLKVEVFIKSEVLRTDAGWQLI